MTDVNTYGPFSNGKSVFQAVWNMIQGFKCQPTKCSWYVTQPTVPADSGTTLAVYKLLYNAEGHALSRRMPFLMP